MIWRCFKLNKYRVNFYSVSGEKFTTFVFGRNLEEAMENMWNFSLNETKFLFPDEENPDKRAVLLEAQQVFYTEFVFESEEFTSDSDKEFELFSFSEFVNLSDADLKTVINFVKDEDVLSKALRYAPENVVSKFYNNMERQKKLSVTVSDETIGDVSEDESEKMQKEICNIALQLAAEGDIILK